MGFASVFRADLQVGDIRKEDAVRGSVAAIVAAHGRIDGLVNNAGGQYITPLEAIDHAYSHEHLEIQNTLKRFIEAEINPHVDEWDDAGEFPRTLYHRAAQLGLLGLGYPEDLGGTPSSQRMRNALAYSLARHGGSGGVFASLLSHNIGLPPVVRHGSTEL